MQPIHDRRRLVEQEGHRHAVKRGQFGKVHFENFPLLMSVLKFLLRVTFISNIGHRNAAAIKLEHSEIVLDELPVSFDGIRILLITDLHIEGIDSLVESIVSAAGKTDYDFCVLGGDYSFHRDQGSGPAYLKMCELATRLKEKTPVYAVLGNHDRYSMAELLDQCGVEMLLNENIRIVKNGENIYLSGLDDCHYYGADDIGQVQSGIADGVCKIMVCHSPERYKEAARAGYSLYLAGHTHGGQVCLPGGAAIVTSTSVPRRLLKGKWKHGAMKGFTSRGVGSTGVAVRFFCRPEITVITLRSKLSKNERTA
ncbi:metallophosphoesterase [Planctomycetota bacterium]